jgi:DNA-directed RNA polymerase subunit beta
MGSVVQKNFRIRNSYGQITKVIDIPNLIDIQKQSYATFLQMDVPADERLDVGLQGVFKSVFPIKDFNETCSLEFVSYHLERPKYVRRRMPSAWYDLCCAAEGGHSPCGLGQRG